MSLQGGVVSRTGHGSHVSVPARVHFHRSILLGRHRRGYSFTCAAQKEERMSEREEKKKSGGAQMLQNVADSAGVSLGPIGLTIGSDLKDSSDESYDEESGPMESIASMTTEEWRQ